jgi:hypothetical protein
MAIRSGWPRCSATAADGTLQIAGFHAWPLATTRKHSKKSSHLMLLEGTGKNMRHVKLKTGREPNPTPLPWGI